MKERRERQMNLKEWIVSLEREIGMIWRDYKLFLTTPMVEPHEIIHCRFHCYCYYIKKDD